MASTQQSTARPKKAGAKATKQAKTKQNKLTARTADKHVLYQWSGQAPETDAKTYARWFKRYTGRELRSKREDFCGTAVLSCHHVKNHKDNKEVLNLNQILVTNHPQKTRKMI